MMKIEYDKDVDAAYIYIEHPIRKGQVKNTIEINEDISVDFDKEGNLLGVEILDASEHLKETTLHTVQKV